MKKLYILTLLLFAACTLFAQYPRNKVVIEEGTGTW